MAKAKKDQPGVPLGGKTYNRIRSGEVSTYEQVHAGDVVLGHDGNAWGVEQIVHDDGVTVVTLVRHGERVTGRPPAGTEVTVLAPADVRAEGWAAQQLIDAFGSVVLIRERWAP